jgi:WD40 repeat protein
MSLDGRTVLTACQDGSARLWNAGTGRLRGKPLEHQGSVLAAIFNADGRTALTGSTDGMGRLWDVATGKLLGQPLVGHRGPLGALAFSRDRRFALTAGHDGTARLWDATLGRPIGPPLEHPAKVRNVAFSTDGRSILTGCEDGTVRLWTIARLTRNLDQLTGWVESLTGLQMDDQGGIGVLDTDAWRKRRQSQSPRDGSPIENERP